VTFGVLQEQPRRGSAREWGEVASVLSHMMGGRQTLVTELTLIINRIQRLGRIDPMRATEELTLVAVLVSERRRSRVPLGEGAFKLLAAPMGPWLVLHRPAHQGPQATPVTAHLHHCRRLNLNVQPHPSLGPLGPRGDVATRQDLHRGP